MVNIRRWKSDIENCGPVDIPVLYDSLTKVTWNEWPRLIRAQTDCSTCGIYRRGTKDVTSFWAVSRSTRLPWSKTVIQPYKTRDLLVLRCLDRYIIMDRSGAQGQSAEMNTVSATFVGPSACRSVLQCDPKDCAIAFVSPPVWSVHRTYSQASTQRIPAVYLSSHRCVRPLFIVSSTRPRQPMEEKGLRHWRCGKSQPWKCWVSLAAAW